MKTVLIKGIRFYQKYLSPLKRVHCPYTPTCSQYALEALRIADERRDVAEEHAWLRIIGNLGNQAIVIEGTHRAILSRTCFRMCFHKHP